MATVALLIVITAGFILFVCLVLIRRLRYETEYDYLELVPPLSNHNQLDSIVMYYKVLHGLLRNSWLRPWPSRQISLELVSERKSGIRFIAVVPKDMSAAFSSITIAHLHGVKIKNIDDYLKGATGQSKVDSFQLKKNFTYPLAREAKLDHADPLAYLSGAMTKLKDGEIVATQLVISAAAPRLASRQLKRLSKTYRALQARGQVSFIVQSKYERLVHKVQQPLFRACIRTLVVSTTESDAEQRRLLISQALSSLEGDSGQRLARRRLNTRGALKMYTARYLGIFTNNRDLFHREELSLLFHFPVRISTSTENLNHSLSRTLPAPVSLKNGHKLDVLLGANWHHGTETPIGLTEAERDRHVYIIGGTGNGKTTMLLYAIVQDIKADKGLAVLDPHGDLAEEVLKHIPEDRIKDVIYMNPDDLTHPIGVNLLELPEGVSGDDLLREKDLVTESTISVMRKIFSDDDTGGHRIEYVLRNTIQTALTLENPTLFTIFDLLNDTMYRKKIVAQLEDKDLKNYWRNELGKAGEFQRVKMAAGITAKIGRFLFSASAKRVLEQPKSTINFEDIMDSGKILICNFSKGLIGEDTSTLFGTTILAKLQMASLRRARLSQRDRRPFYLYVDEFQNFATMSFVQMLSEARKYKLFLTMAEQSTTQQQYQRLVEVILANVGTIICFRSGSPADERLILPLFRPFIDEGEIASLPTYNFYMRIAALQAQEPLSGATKILEEPGRNEVAKEVKESSRALYAEEYKEANPAIIENKRINNRERKSSASSIAKESASAF